MGDGERTEPWELKESLSPRSRLTCTEEAKEEPLGGGIGACARIDGDGPA